MLSSANQINQLFEHRLHHQSQQISKYLRIMRYCVYGGEHRDQHFEISAKGAGKIGQP